LRIESEMARQQLHAKRVEALALVATAYRKLDRPDSSRTALSRAVECWETARDVPLDPAWREQRGSAGSEVYTEWARLQFELAAKSDKAKIQAEVFLQLQRFKARTLIERMYGPGSALAAAIDHEEAALLSLADLQRDVLHEGELFLDAYLGPRVSFAFAVTRHDFRVVTWPAAADLARRLEFYRDLHLLPTIGEVSDAELATLRRADRELGALMLTDLQDLLEPCFRLIVAPDGPLNLLPWTGLVIPGKTAAANECVLADRELVTVPSATILAALRSGAGSRPAAKPTRILAVAGGAAPDGPDLPGTESEVAWLANTVEGVEAVFGRNAEQVPGLAEWRPYSVLHFAAHARARDASPWQSEIRLFREGPGATVTAAEIATARLDADLTVLAGCESAGGRVLSGEGVQGLTSAFLSAGSRCVMATLWSVDDRSTQTFVRDFYRELAGGSPAAAALQSAQHAARSRNATRHPFFWRGFVLVGDGDVTVDLETKPSRWPAVLAVMAAVAVAVGIWQLRRRRRNYQSAVISPSAERLS